MDGIGQKILKELLAPDLDSKFPAPKARKAKKETPGVDHWSAPVLMERAAYLRKLAKFGDGQASEILKEYSQHAVMLSFRARDGVAELHANFADLFFVLEGRATLITGGTVVGPKSMGAGEVRGTSIDGGARQELRVGDVAHVPAGIPHQMLVQGEQIFTALVLKIEQLPEIL